MTYLAKPTGISFKQHIEDVVDEAESYLDTHAIVKKKYKRLTGKSLSKRLRAAAKYHDDGKKDERWQQACKKDYQIYKETGNEKNFKHLRKLGLRHELVRLPAQYRAGFSKPILAAIAAHHRKLSATHEERWKQAGAQEVYKELVRTNNKKKYPVAPKKHFSDALLDNYNYSGPRHLLQLVDHRASAKEPPDSAFIPEFQNFKYNFPHPSKNHVQKLAEGNYDQDLLLLRSPTGSGKTDAALLWAKKQIDHEKADRLIIAMPTRFTSNALAIDIAEQLSETGIYHSSAWFKWHYEEAQQNKTQRQVEKKHFEFARLLETPATVCTIDHLLIALTMTREDHHGIFFNLANSCVVIDEADFYDEFTQANILVLLEVLNILDVPVMIMSATLPATSKNLYNRAGFENVKIKEDKTNAHQKRCYISKKIGYESLADIEPVLQRAFEQPTIIYVNTVQKAIQFYEWFQKRTSNVILYHSRFTEPHKRDKENKLIENLGKEAWKNDEAKGIAIMTQIGEMSVNISANFMLTDLCPGDRFVQRVGRLSRFDEDSIGEVVLMEPERQGELYPAPYGSFAKNGWEPNESLVRTQKLLTCKTYTSQQFVDLVNKVYENEITFSYRAQQVKDQLKKYFVYNWLVTSSEDIKQDEEETNWWKSRDIPPNQDVLTKVPEQNYFRTYYDFMNFKLKYAVSVPLYLIKKALREQIISERVTKIGDSEETYLLVDPSFYSSEMGFNTERKKIEDQFL